MSSGEGSCCNDDFVMRWSPCWYGQAAVNRPVAGSIPAAAALRVESGESRVESDEAWNTTPNAKCEPLDSQLFTLNSPGSHPAG